MAERRVPSPVPPLFPPVLGCKGLPVCGSKQFTFLDAQRPPSNRKMYLEIHPMFRKGMFRKGTSFPCLFLAIFGFSMLATSALPQHGGGGGGIGGGGGGTSGAGRPSGVAERDDLKSFHRAMVLQATAQQSALFTSAVQNAEAASAQLHAFRETLQKAPASSDSPERAATLHDSIEMVRKSNQSFLASFSGAQKSALKDITKQLAKEDSDLARQLQAFDQGIQSAKPASELLASTANLDKVLTNFEGEQLAIGREMSIVIAPTGEQLSFNLPAMPNSLTIA